MGKPVNHGYTHGGSAGKNFGLLFRALFNMVGVGLLWFGLRDWTLWDFSSLPMLAIAGAVITGIGIIANLILPFLHKSK